MNRHHSVHWWKLKRTWAAADNPVGWTVPDVKACSSHGECHLHGLWSSCTHGDSFEASPQLPQLPFLTQTQRTRKVFCGPQSTFWTSIPKASQCGCHLGQSQTPRELRARSQDLGESQAYKRSAVWHPATPQNR